MTDRDLIESLVAYAHVPDVVRARRRIQKLLSEADLHQQALDAAREEGRRVGLEEAAKYHIRFLMERTSVPVEKVVASTEAIRALIDKPGDAQKERE